MEYATSASKSKVSDISLQIICELIDQPHHGIMALMDEACLMVGKTTDKTLLGAMDDKLKTNAHYSSRGINNNKQNKQMELHQHFLIRHYAGDVVYDINGFIEKNRDTLFQDFKRLLYNSKNEIYKYDIIFFLYLQCFAH